MDSSRGILASLPFTTAESDNPSRHLPFRSNSQSSPPSEQHGRLGMAVPGARLDCVPPPLPPPRYNLDLDRGLDLAWRWQNQDRLHGRDPPIPLKPGSSLLGGKSSEPFVRDEDGDVDMELDLGASHMVQPTAYFTASSHLATGNSLPSMTKRVPSPPDLNQGLHGENPLAEQNHKLSTHAYDKHLLLRIGKPHFSPRTGYCEPEPCGGPIRKAPTQAKDVNNSFSPTSVTSPSESNTRWATSPAFSFSPRSRRRWFESPMDSQYPVSGNTSPSYTGERTSSLRPDSYVSGSVPAHEVQRAPKEIEIQTDLRNYESTGYTGEEDLTGEESRSYNLHDLHDYEHPVSVSVRGNKRRALSPLSRVKHTENREQPMSSVHGIKVGFAPARSQTLKSPSLSSTLSSGPQSISTSSYPMSHASSSITSYSSTSYELPTPSITAQPSPATSRPQVLDDPAPAGLNLQGGRGLERPNQSYGPTASSNPKYTLSRIGNLYLCSCCPKQPRKFDTEEKLSAHEKEKPYSCYICTKRFKNKNEAERHQNSLHLRRQSWSCSAISTYTAAFHPSSLSSGRNTDTDTCGFCGEEFGSSPPNWEERIDHINNVHKYGECDASKKFYRADHFRQHLKHSHGSRNGKWTNILENSCLREEAPSESAGLSPTASEHLQSGSAARLQSTLSNPTDAYANAMQVNSEAEEGN